MTTKEQKENANLLVRCPFTNEVFNLTELMYFNSDETGFQEASENIENIIDWISFTNHDDDFKERIQNFCFQLVQIKQLFRTLKPINT